MYIIGERNINLCIFQHVLDNDVVKNFLFSKRGHRNAYYDALQEIIYFYEAESVTDAVIKEYIIRLMVEGDTVLAVAKGGEDVLKAGIIHDCEIFVERLLEHMSVLSVGELSKYSFEGIEEVEPMRFGI